MIIDGIDNCDTEGSYVSSLITYLRSLAEECVLKVLISTRVEWLLPSGAAIMALDSRLPSVHSHHGDIKLYVDRKLDDLSGPDQILNDAGLRLQVRDELLVKAEGMYVFNALAGYLANAAQVSLGDFTDRVYVRIHGRMYNGS